MTREAPPDLLDCLVVGGGPVGLTAALYLARFRRRVLVVDAGEPRAGWIPTSHNIPFFADGIAGSAIIARARQHAARYGVVPMGGRVADLCSSAEVFQATVETQAGVRTLHARRALLATCAIDVEPDLLELPDTVRRGLVRYCPICDGYESRDRRIAVIGHGARGIGEAGFIARTYSDDVTLLTLGRPLAHLPSQRALAEQHRIRLVEAPIEGPDVQDGRVAAIRTCGGAELCFDILYSALGLTYRSGLAEALGAERDAAGALLADAHCQTTVKGLYAAGDVVRGLDQIVVGLGPAAIAATHIHNRCELPTDDEPADLAGDASAPSPAR